MTAGGPFCWPDPAPLGLLMPLHLAIAADGVIVAAGPTMIKLFGQAPLIGAGFLDRFAIRRPAGITDMAGLARVAGRRLHVIAHDAAGTPLRGLAAPLAGGAGFVLNFGFGIHLAEAVRTHGLTDVDFAPSDLAVELLYLVEAKSAVLRELRDLNLRLQHSKAAAEEQALTDTLTGLRNRRALDLALDRILATGHPFGLMHLDLDYFKMVNDTLGHAAGDAVLRQVAQVLCDETRADDTVARIGGDEFVILMPGIADGHRMLQAAQRIIQRLGQPIPYAGQECHVAVSIGLTASGAYGRPQADLMLNDADQALYAAKRAGRGCVRLHGPHHVPEPQARTG